MLRILKPLFFHVLAMALAYGIALLLPAVFDFIFDTHVELFVIVWLNAGLFIMRLKRLAFPLPDMARIDVRGGLRVLWWALFWPRYVLKR